MKRTALILFVIATFSPTAFAIDLFAGKPAGKMGAIEVTASQMRELIAAQTPDVRKAVFDKPDTLRELIRAELLRRALVAEAKKAEWDKRTGVALTMERAREQALIDNFVAEKSRPEADYPSPKEIEAAYEANKSQFRVPVQLRLAQILLRVQQDASKDVEDKVAATAREIGLKLAKGGKFTDLVAQYSQDEDSKEKGGDLGWLSIDALMPQVRAEIANLNPGEISKPLRTPFGWQIIRVNLRKPESVQPLADVHDALVQAMRNARAQENSKRYLESVKARDAVTLDDKAIAEIGKK